MPLIGAAYNWVKLYFTLSTAERMHELLRDVLSARVGLKPGDVSHVFVIIGTKPGVYGDGVKGTSGACTHHSGPVGECWNPAHLATRLPGHYQRPGADKPEPIDRVPRLSEGPQAQ